MFKRIETYFYLFFLAYLAVVLGIKPESITVNFGVVQLNNIKVSNFELALRISTISLAVASVLFNIRDLGKEYATAVSKSRTLNAHVNQSLRQVTGSDRDSVNSSSLTGWMSPSVNTGAWTSFRSAREQVVISVPFSIALIVRLFSLLISLVATWRRVILPALAGGVLLCI